jgi:twinfilin-like protein
LNRLDTILSPKHVIFLVVHHNDALIAVTYVPYLASAKSKNTLLEGRNKVIQELGQDNFAASIICKEMGEITDARSWDERDGQGQSWDDVNARAEQSIGAPEDSHAEHADVKDEGYKKTKCRLCDRCMKNKINDDALSALSSLSEDGACVQVVSHSLHLPITPPNPK